MKTTRNSVTSVALVVTVGSMLFGMAQTDIEFTRIDVGNIVTDQEGTISGTWGDYDGDGRLDLYVANSSLTTDVVNSLYRNNGDGTFTKMLTNAFLATRGRSAAAAWADVDNDGDVDLVAARTFSGPYEVLFNNGGGVFTSSLLTATGWLVCPALADMDGDGWLDMFFSNFTTGANVAYRNQPEGGFRRLASSEVGEIITYTGVSYLSAFGDYDNDGDADLLIGTESGIFLYRNDGKGKFGRVVTGGPTDTAGFSVQWVDYDNDGWMDISVAGITRKIALHRNQGGTNFVNVAATNGFGYSIEAYDSAWGDADNDGDVDLFVVNEYNRTNTFYRNNGNGTFSPVDLGGPIHDGNRDCAVNWVDYNNDGNLDLFIACGDGSPERNLLYRNNGSTNGWLKVRLIGQASNRSGVGAKVRVTATMRGQVVQQTRQISACGWGVGHGLIAHFGLGDATNVDLARIEWPSGIIQSLTNVASGQMLTVEEHQGYGGQPPACASAANLTNGLQLVITEPAPGAVYTVEASTNLVNWTKLMARTSVGSTFAYTDTRSATFAHRFYRVVVP